MSEKRGLGGVKGVTYTLIELEATGLTTDYSAKIRNTQYIGCTTTLRHVDTKVSKE